MLRAVRYAVYFAAVSSRAPRHAARCHSSCLTRATLRSRLTLLDAPLDARRYEALRSDAMRA